MAVVNCFMAVFNVSKNIFCSVQSIINLKRIFFSFATIICTLPGLYNFILNLLLKSSVLHYVLFSYVYDIFYAISKYSSRQTCPFG